jgi:hypothetical protein
VVQLVHAVVDGICRGAQPRVTDFDKTWSPADWRSLVMAVTAALKQYGALFEPNMAEGLAAEGVDGAIVALMASAFEARRAEIRLALLSETTSIASSRLEDFDWNVKLAVSSDSLVELKESILHLSLKVRNPDSTVEDVRMELCKRLLLRWKQPTQLSEN